jgi:hypothetical protein
MDEMSWKLLRSDSLIIADRGAKGISCVLDGNPKACTLIATINDAGEKLPLWAIAKRKTERCER